jgi:hypothetical protein
MGTEIVPETSVSTCNQLTRLCAREDFIESIKSWHSGTEDPEAITERKNQNCYAMRTFAIFLSLCFSLSSPIYLPVFSVSLWRSTHRHNKQTQKPETSHRSVPWCLTTPPWGWTTSDLMVIWCSLGHPCSTPMDGNAGSEWQIHDRVPYYSANMERGRTIQWQCTAFLRWGGISELKYSSFTVTMEHFNYRYLVQSVQRQTCIWSANYAVLSALYPVHLYYV